MKKTILSVSVVVILIALLIFAVFFGLNLGLVNVEPLQDGITLGLTWWAAARLPTRPSSPRA